MMQTKNNRTTRTMQEPPKHAEFVLSSADVPGGEKDILAFDLFDVESDGWDRAQLEYAQLTITLTIWFFGLSVLFPIGLSILLETTTARMTALAFLPSHTNLKQWRTHVHGPRQEKKWQARIRHIQVVVIDKPGGLATSFRN
jgi:hypothetical protein